MHNLQAIGVAAEEADVDGGGDDDEDDHVGAVQSQEPQVLYAEVRAVTQPVHLHHDAQPAVEPVFGTQEPGNLEGFTMQK